MGQKFTIKEDVIGCGIVIVIVIVMLAIISAGNWLWDVSGGKEWYTHHQEQKKAEQRILEVLDDGTERSYDYLRYKTMLSPQVLEEALLTLEKRKRIKHNRKELYLRRYYIVR